MYYGYDHAALSVAYDNRGAFPGWEADFDRGAVKSGPVRARDGARINVSYGETARSIANLYPAPAEGAPILVFIHGGYWRSADHDMFDFVLAPFLEQGAAGVNLEYDLAPTVTMTEIVAQVRGAMRWVSEQAGTLNGDPGRIVVTGHSAGGHLAVMAALDDVPVSRRAVAVGGVYDLEPVRRTVINDDLRLSPEEAQALSPMHLASGQDVSVDLFCGAGELPEFRRQQGAFAAALRSHGMTHSAAELPERDHFNAVFDMVTPGTPVFERISALLADI